MLLEISEKINILCKTLFTVSVKMENFGKIIFNEVSIVYHRKIILDLKNLEKFSINVDFKGKHHLTLQQPIQIRIFKLKIRG